jgi:hypothetical protein
MIIASNFLLAPSFDVSVRRPIKFFGPMLVFDADSRKKCQKIFGWQLALIFTLKEILNFLLISILFENDSKKC